MSFGKDLEVQTAETIRRREENLRLVQLRFQGGRENKGSLLLSQAALAQARFDNLQARNAKRLAQAQLARVLGLDHYEDLDITSEIPVTAPVEPKSNWARCVKLESTLQVWMGLCPRPREARLFMPASGVRSWI